MQRGYIFMGLFFLLPGLLFAIGSWGGYYTDRAILEHGTTAQARIVKKENIYSSEGDSYFERLYEFTPPGGVPIKRHYNIGENEWRSLKECSEVMVHYASANPRRSFPDGYGNTSLSMAIFTCIFGVLFSLLGSGLIYHGLRPAEPGSADSSA